MEPITVKLVLEILGAPKAHVEETLHAILEKLKEEEDVTILSSKTYEPAEMDRLWSTFADVEIETTLPKLFGLCFDYMPSSIEILHPLSLAIPTLDLNSFLNDLQARLHRYDMVIKALNAKKQLQKRREEH